MITASSARPRRRALLLTTVAVGTLALAGCSVTNPTTTTLRYAPADGIELDGETLAVRDLLVVSQGNGAPGVVSGSLVNATDEALTVSVSVNGEVLTPEITVEPNGAARMDGTAPDGTAGDRLVVPALDTPAGQGVEVRVQAGDETLVGNAPVLLPRGPYEQFADDAGGTVEPPASEESDH
ncbi:MULTISPECIES: hypothetical protein [unclassified Ornithinimicrobium]|uniref:hypothetical protein n=1 Tax=unclassified Ornithinimicrobium TaxID=2615080 RepID=UPI003853D378